MVVKKEKTKELYKNVANDAVILARWIAFFLLVLVTVLMFVVNGACRVSGTSMYPTLEDGQSLFVWRLNYTPEQGDIIILDVSDRAGETKEIVKRVIATEGQTVDIDYTYNKVFVDGVALEEDYLNDNGGDADYDVMEKNTEMVVNHITVPEDCVFVMGDNRNVSCDSRYEIYGCLETYRIIGKAMYTD